MKLVLVIALSALLLLGGRTTATAEQVDLELVLAVGVSASVDTYEARLQRQGYLRALVHPMVIRAITSGEHQKIAVTYIEWAGSDKQHIVVGWTIIRDAASARAFAARIARTAPASEWWTSISGLIDFAIGRFAANRHKGGRRVIDISGDGRHNEGGNLKAARARALKAGITINGLPIVNNRPQPFLGGAQRNLDRYFKQHVIVGPGAFVIIARGFKDFGRAIRIKLVREIAGSRWPLAARPMTLPATLPVRR